VLGCMMDARIAMGDADALHVRSRTGQGCRGVPLAAHKGQGFPMGRPVTALIHPPYQQISAVSQHQCAVLARAYPCPQCAVHCSPFLCQGSHACFTPSALKRAHPLPLPQSYAHTRVFVHPLTQPPKSCTPVAPDSLGSGRSHLPVHRHAYGRGGHQRQQLHHTAGGTHSGGAGRLPTGK
jgi:hypothetical protein